MFDRQPKDKIIAARVTHEEFDLILDKFGYYIYDIGYKLYRNTKKVIAKILKR